MRGMACWHAYCSMSVLHARRLQPGVLRASMTQLCWRAFHVWHGMLACFLLMRLCFMCSACSQAL